ncbi:hypothetical protein PIB30_079032 [Stylosanthes scabra]|uniref:Protein FAR1-RELATED SEQUENCE n=1 Tax=Stylosanthes scabra TaxID=79078 RepID=A0ABU6VSZ1_9FABA|nr:hypothetical protein [Stylosanthes scabra]
MGWWCGCKANRKEQKEREADFGDFHTIIHCATKSRVEAQFQQANTNVKFREVQAQFREKVNCVGTFKQWFPGFVVYDVLEEISINRSILFEVTYDTISLEVKCECRLFESRGTVYRHSSMVLSYERIDSISPRYILARWSKNSIVKRRHTSIKNSYDEPSLEPSTKSDNSMLSRAKVHCESASGCLVLTAMVHRSYDNLEAEMKEYKAQNNGKAIITHQDVSLSEMNDLQSPTRIRSRGRPKK